MDETLLSDLSSYKSYKDKAVMMAARSLIQLFRTVCPDLLLKKDRGKPTEASAELGTKKFGQMQTREFVPGNCLVNVFTIIIYAFSDVEKYILVLWLLV